MIGCSKTHPRSRTWQIYVSNLAPQTNWNIALLKTSSGSSRVRTKRIFLQVLFWDLFQSHILQMKKASAKSVPGTEVKVCVTSTWTKTRISMSALRYHSSRDLLRSRRAYKFSKMLREYLSMCLSSSTTPNSSWLTCSSLPCMGRTADKILKLRLYPTRKLFTPSNLVTVIKPKGKLFEINVWQGAIKLCCLLKNQTQKFIASLFHRFNLVENHHLQCSAIAWFSNRVKARSPRIIYFPNRRRRSYFEARFHELVRQRLQRSCKLPLKTR